jgi:hypothetical protein
VQPIFTLARFVERGLPGRFIYETEIEDLARRDFFKKASS